MIKIIKEYYSFREKLKKKIKGNLNLLEYEECCFIEESWINKLEKYFNEYTNEKEKNNLNFDLLLNDILPIKSLEIIDNLESYINSKIKNKKFYLINKDIINLFNKENKLKDYNFVKYYAGNNKLIIEFVPKNNYIELILINSFDENQKNNIFIITINNQNNEIKNLLYNELFDLEEISEKAIENKYNNIIRINRLQNYIDYYINNFNFKKDLLIFFIHIFFYEKSLPNKFDKIFNENQKCYLINPEWLKNFKEYYNYQNLYNLLNNNNQYNNLYYYDLDKQIDNIIKISLKNDILNLKSYEISKEIFNSENIRISLINKNYYFTNCYIINFKIIDLIKKYIYKNINLKFEKKNLFVKDNNIYIIYNNNIIVGNLNKQFIFISKYILFYNSFDLLNYEKDFLLSFPIENYISNRNCNINNFNGQILRTQNKEIGKFINLKNKNNQYKKIINNQTQRNYCPSPIFNKKKN